MIVSSLIISFLIVAVKSQWAWIGGSQAFNLPYSFRQLFVESPDNSPGGLSETAYAMNGSFIYVFGGDVIGSGVASNRLLRFNTNNRLWSVLFAPTSPSAELGVSGVFSASAQPAAKYSSAVFMDKQLNSLFVFGGTFSLEQTENSLYEFNFDVMMWRWMHGSNIINDQGVYGELGVESPLNSPPARAYVAHFYDQVTRKAYFYGGWVSLNRARADLWVYSVQNNTWTWIHGVQHINAVGIYGQVGVGTQFTRPGARIGPTFAFDEIGRKFYLYGGTGTSESTSFGLPTDLWQYEPDRNIWTFLTGNRDSEQRSNYGTRGVTQNGTFPRSRYGGSMVIDQIERKAYLFGGTNDFQRRDSYMNDMWVLDLNSLLWTWISGSNVLNPQARYGTMGVYSPLNNPPPRAWGVYEFLKETRQILLYGGFRYEYFADLWSYSVDQLAAPSEVNSTRTRSTFPTTQIHASIGSTILSLRVTTRAAAAAPLPGVSSSFSGSLVGFFVAVPLFVVGLSAFIIAYLYSKRKSQHQFNEKPANGLSYYAQETNMPETTGQIATDEATIAPTAVGLSLPAHLQVSSFDFRYGELIASGGGGEVFRGDAISEELIELCRAIVIKHPKIVNEGAMKLFEQEICIMYFLSNSDFVAKIIGFMLRPPVLLIKMYSDGSLMSFATKNVLKRKWNLRFTSDVARGLLDIHNAQIAHCDIKPQNVLIDRSLKRCLITDFGIAQVLSEKLLVVKHIEVINVRGLSFEYAAPEVFLRFRSMSESSSPNVVKSSDIFALAMSIYFLLCRKEAWNK